MFSAPYVDVDNLGWSPIGPGPDPAVLIESRFVVNGATFRLLGFRVPMPYSAGWTPSAYWEDDKALHGDGLLWDVEGFKDFVRRVDAMPVDGTGLQTLESEGIELDESMSRLALAWKSVATGLGWSGQDWRPAMVGSQPYIVVGYPEGPARPGLPAYGVTGSQARSWVGRPERQHHFNMRIHGATCGIACAEVRSLSVGGRNVSRPLNPAAADWLAGIDAIVQTLPDAGPRATFNVDGRAMSGLVMPVDAETWAFDDEAFITGAASGLGRGRMRWFIGLPLGEVDLGLARMLEAVAALARERRLGRVGRDLYVACRLDEAPGLLGLDRPPGDPADLRTLIHARLGKAVLRGLGRWEDDSPCLYLGHVLERIYMPTDRLYMCVTAAFANLACEIDARTMLRIPRGDVLIETPLVGDPSMAPEWTSKLPVLLDTPIRALIEDVGHLFEDA